MDDKRAENALKYKMSALFMPKNDCGSRWNSMTFLENKNYQEARGHPIVLFFPKLDHLKRLNIMYFYNNIEGC